MSCKWEQATKADCRTFYHVWRITFRKHQAPFESQHENFYPCTSSEIIHYENVDTVLNRKTDFIQRKWLQTRQKYSIFLPQSLPAMFLVFVPKDRVHAGEELSTLSEKQVQNIVQGNRFHRNIECFRLEGILQIHLVLTSPAMCRDTIYRIRLLRAVSIVVLNAYRDGASIFSLPN